MPEKETIERAHFKSMNEVVEQYGRRVKEAGTDQPSFLDRNLDIGELARAGEYRLADEAYGNLIRRLAKNRFAHLTPDLQSSILQYCTSGPTQNIIKRKRRETEAALRMLKMQTPALRPNGVVSPESMNSTTEPGPSLPVAQDFLEVE